MNDSRFEDLCDRFEASWQAGQPLKISQLLKRVPSSQRNDLLRALLEIELEHRFVTSQNPEPSDYQFAGQDSVVAQAFAATRRRVASLDTAAITRVGYALDKLRDSKSDPDSFDKIFSPPQKPDEIGRLGDFRVQKLLGAGGMGFVFLAKTPAKREPIALKVMRPTVAAIPNAKRRFLREAHAAKKLKHANIVNIFQLGDIHGTPYITMEYLQGQSLQSAIHHGKPLSQAKIIQFAREIASALAFAHSRNLVHRDIKPSNLWITSPSDSIKILDFGLVRDVSDGHVSLTETGDLIGSPKYMSPEQARGEKVGASSDLFSLGSILYQLATGKDAFDGKNVTSTLLAIAKDDPLPIATLRPELHCDFADLIHRLLQKDPKNRPASAVDVYRMLVTLERQATATPPIIKPSRKSTSASQN